MSNIDVNTRLSGLLPFEKYDYVFEGMGGNWPCIITPVSGTIRPYGDVINLDATVHFCTTKTSCPSGTAGFLPYSTGLCDANPNLYTTIRLSLKPENSPYTLHSDIKTVNCNNCFSQPVINTPQSISLTKTDSNEYVMTTTILGLQPNQLYTYNFTSLEANWPIKVSPSSGTLKTTKDRTTLTNHIMFCPNTGLCPVGDNVMNYVTNQTCLNSQTYFGLLQMELINQDCNNNTSVLSNSIPLYCDNCIPSVDINLFSSNKKILSRSENLSGFLLEPIVSGLKTNQNYTYQFKSLNANWPVFANPVSGILKSSASTATISTELFFCSNTGICPEGTKGVLGYSLDSILPNKINNDLYVNLQLELTDTSCSEIHKSETLLIYCNDCLPKPDIRVISNRII